MLKVEGRFIDVFSIEIVKPFLVVDRDGEFVGSAVILSSGITEHLPNTSFEKLIEKLQRLWCRFSTVHIEDFNED